MPPETPALIAHSGGIAAAIAARVPALRAYAPPAGVLAWAAGGHAQTLIGGGRACEVAGGACAAADGSSANAAPSSPLFPPVARAATVRGSYRRQFVRLPDGGTVALDWWRAPRAAPTTPPTAPLFLVLHGLTGGSREGYCKAACAAAAAAGFRAAVLTYRGCGGLPLTSGRPYGAAWTADVAAAADAARGAYPAARALVTVGYSLGAVILTKYLSEAAAGAWPASVDAAACVSSPFCLHSASEALGASWSGLAYNAALAARLRCYFRAHQAPLRAGVAEAAAAAAADARKGLPRPPVADLDSLSTAWLIQHYDARAVAALFGYADAAAYYDDASSLAHIPGVRTPTLYLAARDDPFLGKLPTDLVAANPATALAVTDRGGHCAFLGPDLLGVAWADKAVVGWAAEALAAIGLGRPVPPQPPPPPRSRL